MAIIAVLLDHSNGIFYTSSWIATSSYFSVSLFVILTGMTQKIVAVRKERFGGAFVRIAKMLRDYAIAVLVLQCMIYIGFEKGIKTIYWCISPQNQRAVKFYDKNGYQRNDMCKTLAKKYYDIDEINRYIWYVVEKQ